MKMRKSTISPTRSTETPFGADPVKPHEHPRIHAEPESGGDSRKLPSARLRTQADTCTGILSEILDAVLGKSLPADQFLAGRFRKDRRFGSRDRRLISRAVFSVFRQYGFLREAFGFRPENGSDRRVLSLCILGAALLEGYLPETYPRHLEDAGLREDAFLRIFEIRDELERFRRFAALAGSEYSPDISHILPGWALPELVQPFDERFYRAMRTRPPMWIRTQTDRIDFLLKSLAEAGLAAVRHPALPDAFSIADAHVNLHTMEAYRKGLFELQDISSQCIGRACMPSRGETWWDACSGGGGKALQLASLLHRTGVVTATDIRARKLAELKKRAARAAFPNIRIMEWDEKKQGKKCFSGVLVDAPCSSSGRWRRNPEARWTAKPPALQSLRKTQLEILNHASQAVRPGGVLVYATCSMFRRENASVVHAFLESHPEFHLEPFPNPLTGEMNSGMQQIMPWDADCDASFAARMRRN